MSTYRVNSGQHVTKYVLVNTAADLTQRCPAHHALETRITLGIQETQTSSIVNLNRTPPKIAPGPVQYSVACPRSQVGTPYDQVLWGSHKAQVCKSRKIRGLLMKTD